MTWSSVKATLSYQSLRAARSSSWSSDRITTVSAGMCATCVAMLVLVLAPRRRFLPIRAVFLGGRVYSRAWLNERMRALVLVAACIILARPADGQQTEAAYFIPGASTSMTTASLAGAGLPSYSALTLTDQTGVVTVGVEACPAGGYSLEDAQVCTLCPAGKFSGTVTATSLATCVSCDAGKYSTMAGASSSLTCVDCQNGTYSTTVGASLAGTCLVCPANSSSYPGSKLLQACVCLPGYAGPNGAACSPCNTSTWCLFGQAYPCPPNSRSGPTSSSLAQCLCVGGYYGDTSMGGPELTLCQVPRTDARACEPCKPNDVCGSFARRTTSALAARPTRRRSVRTASTACLARTTPATATARTARAAGRTPST